MKKLIFIGTLVITVSLIIGYLIFDDLKKSSEILFEDSVLNAAWGYKYYGYVICRDGSVYSFDISEQDLGTNIKDLKSQSKYILKNAKLQKKLEVSKPDLEKMIRYSKYIDGSKVGEIKQRSWDLGSRTIKMYEYESGAIIDLKETGDMEVENTSQYAKELVELIQKYTRNEE